MAKRIKRRLSRYRGRLRFRRRKNRKIAMLPLLGGVVYPVLDSVCKSNFINDIQGEDKIGACKGLLDQLSQHYTGFSPFPELGAGTAFQPMEAVKTYGALAFGVVGHMLANKFGVNRNIAKIPLIGGRIEL